MMRGPGPTMTAEELRAWEERQRATPPSTWPARQLVAELSDAALEELRLMVRDERGLRRDRRKREGGVGHPAP